MKHCKGCNAKYICLYTKHSTTCPCPTCLIKMVCNVICEEYTDFKVKTKKQIFKTRYKTKKWYRTPTKV
jgi:hypothetical protein